MGQITLNTKLNSESFTTNDSDIIYLLPLVVDGSTVGSKIISIDTANVDTQVIEVEESVATIAALTKALVQVTLDDRSTPYISIARIKDIIDENGLAVIKYDGNGNVFQTLNTLMTVAQVLTAIDVKQNEPKKYVALLTQSGTNAPVATVLENTLGVTVVWLYDGVGVYRANVGNTIIPDLNKVYNMINNSYGEGVSISSYADSGAVNRFSINTFDQTDTLANGILYNTSVEFRIYP